VAIHNPTHSKRERSSAKTNGKNGWNRARKGGATSDLPLSKADPNRLPFDHDHRPLRIRGAAAAAFRRESQVAISAKDNDCFGAVRVKEDVAQLKEG
jgi:hypothetical protein